MFCKLGRAIYTRVDSHITEVVWWGTTVARLQCSHQFKQYHLAELYMTHMDQAIEDQACKSRVGLMHVWE